MKEYEGLPSPGSKAFLKLPEKQQKGILLKHYAQRPPTTFGQLDGFVLGKDGSDDFMRPDQDGDWLCGGSTNELMYGANVRILIKKGTSSQDAVRLIKKLLEFFKGDPDWATNGVIGTHSPNRCSAEAEIPERGDDVICICPYCNRDITREAAESSIHCCPHCGEWLDLFLNEKGEYTPHPRRLTEAEISKACQKVR